ncbi:hypothetical protein H6F61_07810 [Cyanobacteria bacterium FACHB-472]|nr:hypothetical protein [Cyanobacteria bacterium FACHB-472]
MFCAGNQHPERPTWTFQLAERQDQYQEIVCEGNWLLVELDDMSAVAELDKAEEINVPLTAEEKKRIELMVRAATEKFKS